MTVDDHDRTRSGRTRPHGLAAHAVMLWAMALLVALVTAMPPLAHAQAWPARPLRLIVPFPPGGAADTIGRLLAARLGERLGQPVVVENRAGGGTIIAAQAAAQAAPDGLTLSLATTGQLAINPALHAKLPYDPLRSFAPVALVATTAYIVSVNASSPIQSLKQLIDEAKRRPGLLTFSSWGNGTVCHLTGELLETTVGIDLIHVPFSGSAPAITALLGDQVQIAADTVAVNAPQIQAGKLRGLVVTSAQRSPVVPGVPSATEAGLPDFLSDSWFGVVVPAATPADIVRRLHAEISAITRQPEVREQLARQGLDVLDGDPERFARVIESDIAKWGRVVRPANVSLQ